MCLRDKPALTPWGEPDLRGVWDNASTATPWERPAALAGKTSLTDEEVAERQQAENALVAERESGKDFTEVGRPTLADSPIAGNEYNSVWYSEGRPRNIINRTSLVVEPDDGRIPVMTERAQRMAKRRRVYRQENPANSWLDRSTYDRCILGFNAGPPITPGGYNQNMQLLQTPDHVVLITEMVHTHRVVPLDGRPYLGHDVRQWSGDSRGYWEGDTLVVETRNFKGERGWRGTSENMTLVERFTRVDTNTLEYRFTVTDPATWTSPWTASIPMRLNDQPMYEYACHEGNYSMPGILGGARMDEQKAAGH